MEKLTILIKPTGHSRMEFNLHEICTKHEVRYGPAFKIGTFKKEYPCTKNQLKKIFALICRYSDDDTIINVQKFLDTNKPDYGQLFEDVRSGNVKVNLRRYEL